MTGACAPRCNIFDTISAVRHRHRHSRAFVANDSHLRIAELKQGSRRVGVLGNADDPFMKPFFEQIQRGAPSVPLEVHEIIVRGSDELNGAFAAIARERADAVVIQGSLPVNLTVDLALKYQLPSLSTQKSAVQAGILMSYSASFAERARVIGNYVDQILKGAKHPPIFRCSSRPGTNWRSISRLLRPSASRFRLRCSPAPTR
jgi:hypothetical protein